MDHREMYLNFGQNLRCLRIARGLTQKETARRLGISAATLSKLERGLPSPRTSVAPLLRIQSVFGISPGDLFEPDMFLKRYSAK